jgi:hypothetical protein
MSFPDILDEMKKRRDASQVSTDRESRRTSSPLLILLRSKEHEPNNRQSSDGDTDTHHEK